MRAPLATAATLVVLAGGFGVGLLAGRSGAEAPAPVPAPSLVEAPEAPVIPALDDDWAQLPALQDRSAPPAVTGSSSPPTSAGSGGSSPPPPPPAADPAPSDDEIIIDE